MQKNAQQLDATSSKVVHSMLLSALRETTKTSPQKIAIIMGKNRLSYHQLMERIELFIDRLHFFSVGEGDCIALILPNSIEFVVSFYALAGLKAIALPLNPILKMDELKYYLIDNNIKTIVTDTERAAIFASVANELDRDIAIVIADDQGTSKATSQHPTTEKSIPPHIPFEGPVSCQYSSGSTGQAKKVHRTQKQLGYEIKAFVSGVHMTAADTILCVVPLFHALGFGKCMLCSIATGATLVILEPIIRDRVTVEVPFVFRVQRVLELIEQERISILPASPYIFGALAETPEDTQVDVSSLRLCMTGGNLLPEETFTSFKRKFGLPLRSIYGSTETGPIALNMEPDSDVRYDTAGKPCKNVEVRITDATLKEFPVGSIGEVAIRSQAMATSYLNMPALNREQFRGGFFFIGDLGKKDEQGLLYITGRKKVFIDSGGEKADPVEIERILLTHPAVQEAVVIGIPGPYGGEAIKAIIVSQGELTELEILLYCKDRLSNYKVPRVVEFREALPRNLLGKLVRKELIEGQNLVTTIPTTPKDKIMRSSIVLALTSGHESAEQLLLMQLCEQAATLLHRDVAEIDAQLPLGELGLDSLMAVELRDWLEIQLELTFPVTLFWSYPTASALATHLVTRLRQSIKTKQGAAIASELETLETEPVIDEIAHLSDTEVQQHLDAMTTVIWKDESTDIASISNLTSYLMQLEQMSDAEIQQNLSQEIERGQK